LFIILKSISFLLEKFTDLFAQKPENAKLSKMQNKGRYE